MKLLQSIDNTSVYKPNLSRRTSLAGRVFISPSFEMTTFSPLSAVFHQLVKKFHSLLKANGGILFQVGQVFLSAV